MKVVLKLTEEQVERAKEFEGNKVVRVCSPSEAYVLALYNSRLEGDRLVMEEEKDYLFPMPALRALYYILYGREVVQRYGIQIMELDDIEPEIIEGDSSGRPWWAGTDVYMLYLGSQDERIEYLRPRIQDIIESNNMAYEGYLPTGMKEVKDSYGKNYPVAYSDVAMAASYTKDIIDPIFMLLAKYDIYGTSSFFVTVMSMDNYKSFDTIYPNMEKVEETIVKLKRLGILPDYLYYKLEN